MCASEHLVDFESLCDLCDQSERWMGNDGLRKLSEYWGKEVDSYTNIMHEPVLGSQYSRLADSSTALRIILPCSLVPGREMGKVQSKCMMHPAWPTHFAMSL